MSLNSCVMVMLYRNWLDLDPAIRARYIATLEVALPKIREVVLAKGWPKDALANVLEYLKLPVLIRSGLTALVINDEYLFLYAIGDGWWSTRPYMVEEFIFALEPNGNFDACLAVIENHARELGCGSVCIGTAAARSDKAYARHLSRRGYKTLAYQLVKEV